MANDTFSLNSDYLFGNGKTQSDEKSYLGTFGCKLDSNNKYGATINLPVKAGDILNIRVKRSIGSKSSLVLSVDGGRKVSTKTGDKINDEWEELQINTTVYSEIESTIAKIYLNYNEKDNTAAYFDQLEIEVLGRDDTVSHPFIENSVSIIIPEVELNKIKEARKKAFKTGIIVDSLKFWVPITVSYNGKSIKGKYKIKGDWTEHVETDKWGAKLSLKSPIFDSKKFSIMKPESRSGLREILFHEVLKDHNILTTNYFLNGVIINDINKGYFAFEEHFTAMYLENRNLPKGPILKIDEKLLWANRSENYLFGMYQSESKVTYYKLEKIKNYVKSHKIDEANAEYLLDQFRNGSGQLDSIFDMEYTSTFFALANAFAAKHCLIWHNMRFYYNPTTKKLYPIGYDAYSHGGYLFRGNYTGSTPDEYLSGWSSLFLNNKTFSELYLKKLAEFSTADFITKALKKHEDILYSSLMKIKKEQCSYDEDFKFLYKNVKSIQNHLEK